MAFRIEAAACLVLAGGFLAAQELTFDVRLDHWHEGGAGRLTFKAEGIRWDEAAKKHEHSRSWKYEDIQRLELAPDHVRIVTYEDVGWRFDRDRPYLFHQLPADLAARVYPLLTERMDQRLVAHIVDPKVVPVWETQAKLLLGRGGSSGTLKLGPAHVVFDGGERGESRTWRYSDITNVASAGPFDLTISTIEGENRIQLKQPLAGARFDDLWQRISEANGLKIYPEQLANHAH
jgi:hypothetical protein